MELDYGDARDVFEWQVFLPDELAALAVQCGLEEMLRCANFDENISPRSDLPRMQFIFQKTE